MRIFVIKTVNIILAAAVLFTYQYYAGRRQETIAAHEKENAAALAQTTKETKFADGEYEGSGEGFGGEICVKLTVQQGKIQSADIVSADGETPEYLNSAKKILDEVVERQTADVDTVSGATLSSNGILAAVRQAMEKCDEK